MRPKSVYPDNLADIIFPQSQQTEENIQQMLLQVEQLPEDYKKVILLYYKERKTLSETAEELNLTVGQVKA